MDTIDLGAKKDLGALILQYFAPLRYFSAVQHIGGSAPCNSRPDGKPFGGYFMCAGLRGDSATFPLISLIAFHTGGRNPDGAAHASEQSHVHAGWSGLDQPIQAPWSL